MSHLTLDSQMLLDLYGGSRDDARFILNDYIEKHDEIVSAFHEAFHAGIDSLSRCAHRHSSSFSYIGLPQLTSECKNFELECKKAADTSRVKNSFEKLLITIKQSIVLVKQELVRLDKA
jgi:HPt (histidine-containing phosphotransfer) domain-containing protein